MGTTDGGGSGPSGTIRVIDADEITSIANADLGGAFDRLRTALAQFEGLAEGSSIFGDSGPGAELASLHAGIKGVFVSTVDGVSTDLDGMHHNLSRSAENWRDADLTAADRSNALCQLVESGTTALAGDAGYDGGRESAGDDLLTGEELAQRQEEIRAEEAAQAEADGPPEPGATGPDDQGA